MGDEFKTIIKNHLVGSEAVISTYTPRAVYCKEVIVKDEHYFELITINDEKILLNKINCISIRYKDKREFYEVIMKLITSTKGEVLEIDNGFILIEIFDNTNSKYYQKLIPIKQIENVKILYEGQNEEDLE